MIKIVSPKKGSNAELIMWLMFVILCCTLLLMVIGMKFRHDIMTRLDEIEALTLSGNIENVSTKDAGSGVGTIAAVIDINAVDHPPRELFDLEPVVETVMMGPIELETTVETVEEDLSYLKYYIDLPIEHQILLHNACEEFDIPFELALAVVWRETRYVNQVSANGEYFGYMMLAEKWVEPEMKKLGVTDLMDPEGNFRIGCCLLRQFIDSKGSVEAALGRYNNDSTGKYASEVLTYMNDKLMN